MTTLPQVAGVGLDLIPRLVVKELVDNALDASGACTCGLLSGGDGFFVEDKGRGIGGSDDEIAGLFSIGRPLVSTKLFRLPTRGALGNGLRVVAGAVLASGGKLEVATRGRMLRLTPRGLPDGGTTVERDGSYMRPGTRIEVKLGPPLVVDKSALWWGQYAILLASRGGRRYEGETSPHWYDLDTFHDLLRAAKGRMVRDLIAGFSGCAGAKASQITAGFKKGRLASELSRDEASILLTAAKKLAKPIAAKHLGCVGPIEGLPPGYAKHLGEMVLPETRSGKISVPVVVEAWARPADEPSFHVLVNRTPVATGETNASHEKTTLTLYGCNLGYDFHDVGRQPSRVLINVETPYMPIVTGGKEPDLRPIVDELYEVITKAIRSGKAAARRQAPKSDGKVTVAGLFRKHLAEAIDKASSGGNYVFSQRRLYYALRPFILTAGLPEPSNNAWGKLITKHELKNGQIEGLYFDVRGILYHPHMGEEIPLGTLSVRKYERPRWTFNKILYIEKESLISILRANGWPERNDCALMSAKGFASRAARDVIDMIGETDEPIQFFCIHDGDASGTLIHQALKDGTDARPGRKVEVINLGLDPWEAVEMGLDTEKVVQRKNKKGQLIQRPVADYIDEHEGNWREWLQTNRAELDAMATPQFIDWLDGNFAPYVGKVIPPAEVMRDRLVADAEEMVRAAEIARILREADLDGQVKARMRRLTPKLKVTAKTLGVVVDADLKATPEHPWTSPVRAAARSIASS